MLAVRDVGIILPVPDVVELAAADLGVGLV